MKASGISLALLVALSLLLSTITTASGRSTATSQKALPFKVIASGWIGVCEESCYELITTASQWARFWNGQSSYEPLGTRLPPIDFSRQVVVVAEMGTVATSGYSVQITKLTAVNHVLEVSVRLAAPVGGVNDHPERPYEIVSVETKSRRANFTIEFENYYCSPDDQVFCGIAPGNRPVGLNGTCTPVNGRPSGSTCYGAGQLRKAELHFQFPVTPFNPTPAIVRTTRLRPTKIVVEWIDNGPGVGRVPWAIHFLYGKLPPPKFVPVVLGRIQQVRSRVPVFRYAPDVAHMGFLDATEYIDSSTAIGVWLQRENAPVNPSNGTAPFIWHGPWRLVTSLRTHLMLSLAVYAKPAIVRNVGAKVATAASQ